MNLIFVMCRIL